MYQLLRLNAILESGLENFLYHIIYLYQCHNNNPTFYFQHPVLNHRANDRSINAELSQRPYTGIIGGSIYVDRAFDHCSCGFVQSI